MFHEMHLGAVPPHCAFPPEEELELEELLELVLLTLTDAVLTDADATEVDVLLVLMELLELVEPELAPVETEDEELVDACDVEAE